MINQRPWPVYGMYQPDTIKFLTIGGVDYLLTANEGDSKDYNFFSEEERGHDITLSSVFGKFNVCRCCFFFCCCCCFCFFLLFVFSHSTRLLNKPMLSNRPGVL